MLNEFKWINLLLFPLKSSENSSFSGKDTNFNEIWRQSIRNKCIFLFFDFECVCVCVCVCVRVCVVGGKMNENAQMILHWHYFSQF